MRPQLLALLTASLLFGCEAQIEDLPLPATPTAAPLEAPIAPPAAQPPPVEAPPPVEQPPTEQPPVEQPPTEQPPVNQPPTSTGTLSLSLPSTQLTLHLNESKSVVATVTPRNGFTGTATLAIAGLPTGVTATFSPASVDFATAAPAEVLVTLHSKSEMLGSTGTPLTLTTSSGAISSSAPLTLDVLQEVLITIAKGVNLGTSQAPNTAAFGAVSTPVMFVAPGTKVTFINLDTRTHEIHANANSVGLQHEQGQLQPNGANSYSQILKSGSVNFRCHIHPNMLGQIVVR